MLKKFIENRRAAAKRGGTPVSVPTATQIAIKGPASTQAWMPVQDVYNGFIHRRDSAIIAAIRVQPVNFELLSDNEKFRKIKLLEEVMNGIDFSFQIISIARPVDLDGFIAKMGEMKLQTTVNQGSDRIKSRLLAGYMAHAAAMATSGEAVERQFYILLDQPAGKKAQQNESLLYARAAELAASLSGADLTSHVCNDEELRDLLFVFTNPQQASFERAPLTQIKLPAVFHNDQEVDVP